jgi:hypothetical protein
VTDLTISRSGEFGVYSIQAETDAAVDFVDAWHGRPGELIVVDSGWIILPCVRVFQRDAEAAGFTITHKVVT